MTQYSVHECLDRVEQVLESSARIPFTNKRAVDVLEILDLLDRVRIALPEDVHDVRDMRDARDSRSVKAQGGAGPAGASAGADRVAGTQAQASAGDAGRRGTQGTRERSSRPSEPDERSAALIAQAQAEAEQIRAGARDYAETTLKSLSDTLERTSAVVQRGIDELKRRGLTQG